MSAPPVVTAEQLLEALRCGVDKIGWIDAQCGLSGVCLDGWFNLEVAAKALNEWLKDSEAWRRTKAVEQISVGG
jgi:hypothetical protein